MARLTAADKKRIEEQQRDVQILKDPAAREIIRSEARSGIILDVPQAVKDVIAAGTSELLRDPFPGRKVPVQKPGRSEQEVETPPEFIEAVEARWGKLAFDLAASEQNTKAPAFFDKEADSLKQDWTKLRGNLWLNPEFGDIAPYAAKCQESRGFPHHAPSSGTDWRRIFLLTPAGVSTNWFFESIYGNARVIAIQRLRFVGHETDYPKDLILSVFGDEPGFEVWRWKDYGKAP